MKKLTLAPHFPFRAEKWPFFYGYFLVFAGLLGILFSIPGQTIGVSAFTDDLIRISELNRNQLSLTYMIGTILASTLVTGAGVLFDRMGARLLGMMVSIALGSLLITMSYSENIMALWADGQQSWLFTFIYFCIAFFFLRFLGQGAMTLLSRNMVMMWFEKLRGMANALIGVGTSAGFNVAPAVLLALIVAFEWDGAWRLMGLVTLLGMSSFIFLFFRNQPEDHGLVPDGASDRKSIKFLPDIPPAKDKTLKEAIGTLTFWAFTIGLSLQGFWITGFTFHFRDLFEKTGYSEAAAAAVFIWSGAIAIVINLTASIIYHKLGLPRLLRLLLLAMATNAVGVLFLGTGWAYVFVIIGMGVSGGMFAVLISLVWPHYFGRKHLGAISGFNLSGLSFASALGPITLSMTLSWFGKYGPASWVVFCIAGSLFVVSFFVKREFKD